MEPQLVVILRLRLNDPLPIPIFIDLPTVSYNLAWVTWICRLAA